MSLLAAVLLAAWLAVLFGAGRGSSGRPPAAANRPYLEGMSDAGFTIAMGLAILGPLSEVVGGVELIDSLDGTLGQAFGIVLMPAALVFAVLAQREMGSAWRTYVDPASNEPLATRGPFGLVRNPVSTAMVVAVVASVFLAPTVIGLLALGLLIAVLELQVRRVEEPFLAARHGEQWRDYAQATGRFFPFVGTGT